MKSSKERLIGLLRKALLRVADLLLSCVAPFLVRSHTRYTPRRDDSSRVLFCRPDHVGDVIMALPALAEFRRRYPHMHITVWAAGWTDSFLRSTNLFDAVVTIDPPWWARKHGRTANWFIFLKHVRNLRDCFDVAIDMRGDLRLLMCLAFLVRPKTLLARLRQGGKALATRGASIDESSHEIAQNFRLLRSLAFDIDTTMPPAGFGLRCDPVIRTKVERILKTSLIERSQLIVLHPFAKQVNRWPMQFFRQLVSELVNLGFKIVITGVGFERIMADNLSEIAPNRIVNVAGHFNLQELQALISLACVYVSADTGPMHLLNAVQTKGVLLFGPTEPERFAPLTEGHRIIRGEECCMRALHEHCLRRTNDGWSACMSSIPVHAVLTAVLETSSSLR